MTEEIAELKNLIDAMHGGTFHDMKSRALHQKKMGQLEFKFHFFLRRSASSCSAKI